jgi:hypothetical protein
MVTIVRGEGRLSGALPRTVSFIAAIADGRLA